MKKIIDIYNRFNVAKVTNDVIVIDATNDRIYGFHVFIILLYIPLLGGILTYNTLETVLEFVLALLAFLFLVLLYVLKKKICTKRIVFDRIRKEVTIQNHFKFKQVTYKELSLKETKIGAVSVTKVYLNNVYFIAYFNNIFHEILERFMSSDKQFLKHDLVHYKEEEIF